MDVLNVVFKYIRKVLFLVFKFVVRIEIKFKCFFLFFIFDSGI